MKGGAYFTILIERLVPVQLTSPSGQASPRGTPSTYLTMYASVCPVSRALLCSFLDPAQPFPTQGEIVQRALGADWPAWDCSRTVRWQGLPSNPVDPSQPLED